MQTFEQNNFTKKIVVVTNLLDNFSKCLEAVNNLCFYIVLSGFSSGAEELNQFKELKSFFNTVSGIYILGVEDLKFIKNNYHNRAAAEIVSWLQDQYISARISYKNGNIYSFLYGGITSDQIGWSEVAESIDSIMIEQQEGLPWQQFYNGRFGYVTSFSPANERVKLFTHSCSAGLSLGESCLVTFNENGVENIKYY